jgi:hypothetical protein
VPGINTGSKEPNSLVRAEAVPAFIPVVVWWVLEIILEPSTCFIQVSIPHIYIERYLPDTNQKSVLDPITGQDWYESC